MLKKIFFVTLCVFCCFNNFALRYKSCSLQKANNDVSVIFIDTEKTDNTTIAFCVSVGTADESDKSGIANLLTNLICENVKTFIESDEKFKGTELHSATDYDKSIFYVTSKSENTAELIHAFSERFSNLSVSDEDIELVKESASKQIAEQSEVQTLRNESRRALYWHAKYGNDILGTLEDLKSVTLTDIVNFKNKFYRNNRLTILVAGNVNKGAVINAVQDYFPKTEPAEIQRLQEPPHHDATAEILKANSQQSSSTIEMYWKAPCCRTSSEDCVSIEILAAHIEEALRKSLMENQKIITSISVKTSLWNYGNGEIILTAEIQNDIDIEYAKTAILAELKSIAYKKMTKEQAEKISQRLSNSYPLNNSDVSDAISFIAQKFGSGNELSVIKEWPSLLRKFNLDNLNSQKIFKQNPCVISVIKRRENVLQTNDSK